MNLVKELADRVDCSSLYELQKTMYEYNERGPNIGFHIVWPSGESEWVKGCYVADFDQLEDFATMEREGVQVIAISVSFAVENSCVELGPEELTASTPIERFDAVYDNLTEQAKHYWERDNCLHLCLKNLSTEEQYVVTIDPYDGRILQHNDLTSLPKTVLEGINKRAQGTRFKVPGWSLRKIPMDIVCAQYDDAHFL